MSILRKCAGNTIVKQRDPHIELICDYKGNSKEMVAVRVLNKSERKKTGTIKTLLNQEGVMAMSNHFWGSFKLFKEIH